MAEPGDGDDRGRFLEVEEAELSSDDDVLGAGDDSGARAHGVDGERDVDADRGGATDGGRDDAASGVSGSGSGDLEEDDGPDEDEYQIEEEGSEDGGGSDEQAEDSNDDDVVIEEDDGSGAESEDANDAPGADDNDDDDSGTEVVQRPMHRRGTALKIPDEMLDNAGEYFRRSSRQRRAIDRYAGDDDGGDSSDAAAEKDSDFDGDGGDDDEDDEDDEDDDDDDDDDDGDSSDGGDSCDAPKATRRRTRKAQRRPRKVAAVGDGSAVMDAGCKSSSGSDGDWASRPSAGKRRGRREPKRRARPAARRSEEDEDDFAQTARINARTGDAVNYAEAADDDSDIFDEEDAAANRAAKASAGTASPHVESIALVCDYRVPPGECSRADEDSRDGPTKVPFSDFDPGTVEFYVNWTGKSFRRNTWRRQDDLRHVKGFKKVTNYIGRILARFDELRQPYVSSEELEDAAILFVENREALREYTVVDRVVDERESTEAGGEVTEYLVKWQNLPYRDCTWEPASALSSDADVKAIDMYSDRVQTALATTAKTKRFNPFGKESRGKFRRMATQPEFLHGEGRTLREYQLAGLNWLAFSWTNNRNVILADEMGLGKTVQTVSLLGWIQYRRNVPGPFLVVVPLSTIAAWVREFARWLPDMNVVCYTGDSPSRSIVREHEFQPVQRSGSRGTGVGFHALLTTPELAMMDMEHLAPIRWAVIAVDEAHRLKNKDSELHRSLLELTSANRLLITGTPLQNSVGELWALLHFLNPVQFDDADEFEESFSFAALRDEDRVAALHNTLRPYIIRRQKVDVEKSLPKKTYNVLRVGMTTNQQHLYRLLLTKNYAKLNAGLKGRGMGPKTTLRNLVMELKKCCNHPFLFDNVEDTSVKTTVETLIRASGKMILLDKLLLRLRERGHRVLVFSQMVRMLDILSDYCRMRGFPYQRLDGSMPNDLRVRAVDHYNAPGSTDYVFLLSTRAGGLGINLATADTVIIFDSDWNPQNDLQAESRAHRIGQTKDVKVFRLLSRETVEEDILERAKRKRVLEHLVIHGVEGDEQDKDGKNRFNKKELSAILRFGAEKLFKEVPAEDAGEAAQANGKAGGAAAVPSGDDAQAEERRVLEVDDIDELLARTPAEPEDELGTAEPTMGDSLLNAFKWADFDPIAEEEKAEVDDADTAGARAQLAAAKDAARGIGSLEDRRKRELAKARAKQEREDAALEEEDDTDYWNRVIPDNEKSRAVAEAMDDELIVGTRKRKRTRTYGTIDSPDADGGKASRRAQRSSRAKGGVEHGVLTRKEERQLFRSWRKFGAVSRTADILRDAGVADRIDEGAARGLLEAALATARAELRRARDNPRPTAADPSRGDADGADGKPAKVPAKSKAPAVVVDVLGEQVNARDLVQRCEDLELLGHRIAQTSTSDTQFRLRRQIKPPAYGVAWKSKHDAMLLVGAFRHGLGNWGLIAADGDLQLSDKMNVPGSGTEIKGAPDATKLMRRATALLRELAEEERALTQKNAKRSKKKSPRHSDRKAVKGSRRTSASRGTKRDRVDGGGGEPPKAKKRAKPSNSSSRASRYSDRLKATQLRALKELRKLSHKDVQMDQKDKVRRMKACLYELGTEIVKLSGSDGDVRRDLWGYVHGACRTAFVGDRLEVLYNKLAVEHNQRDKR